MPLYYVGAAPINSTDPITINYVNSLVSKSFSQTQVTAEISSAFRPSNGGNYATSDYVDQQVALLATKANVDAGNATKIPSLTPTEISNGVRINGPITLDSTTGRLPKNKFSSASLQRWAQGNWSPSSASVNALAGKTATTTETTLLSFTVSPTNQQSTPAYKIIPTGIISAKISTDALDSPKIVIRANNPTTGPIVGVGYGISENYRTGVGYNINNGLPTLNNTGQVISVPWDIPACDKLDVVAIGGGGGGFNGAGLGFNGGGGGAGKWAATTIIRGTSPGGTLPAGVQYIPLSQTKLHFVIGAGGPNMNFLGGGGTGGLSAVFGSPIAPGAANNPLSMWDFTTNPTPTLLTSGAAGGGNGAKQGQTMVGEGAPNFIYYNGAVNTANGVTYPNSFGGQNLYSNPPRNAGTDPWAVNQTVAINGNAPGGGGQGGRGDALGGYFGAPGAAGAVFVYTYSQDDNNYGQIQIVPAETNKSTTTFTSSTTLYVNLVRSGQNSATITTSNINPQISVMVVPA